MEIVWVLFGKKRWGGSIELNVSPIPGKSCKRQDPLEKEHSHQLEEMMMEADVDGDGQIDFEEFAKLIT